MLAVYTMNNREEAMKKYAEAKTDMIKARKSFDELTPQQRNQLINELVLEQTAGALINRLNNYR